MGHSNEPSFSYESDSDSMSDVSSDRDFAEISFGELKEIRKIDTSSTRSKKYSKDEEEFSKIPKKAKRDKDAPLEKSSKIPVSRNQVVIPGASKPKTRDPRFDGDAMTDAERARFRKRYHFIDEMYEEEIQTLKKAMKKEKNPEELEKMKTALNIMESRKRSEKQFDLRNKVKEEFMQEQREQISQGKRGSFITEKEIQKRMRLKEFENLEQSGQLNKYLAKKRKRVASKEKKSTPFKRPKLREEE